MSHFVGTWDPVCRERVVVFVLAIYTGMWTLYGVIAKGSQDVHSDTAEIVAWSRDLALGYPKHPPLAPWLIYIWSSVFPIDDWTVYLLAMVVAAAALWITWRLAKDYLDDERRVLALAILMLVPFYNFHALKFNVNVVLMPMWAATTLCFLRSYERRSSGWGALAGLCAAGAILGKYWSIFLLAGLGLAAVLDSRRAAYFRSAAPWITIAVGAVVIAPHVAWLIQSDFVPIRYASFVHATVEGGSRLLTTVYYLINSAAYISVAVLLALAVIRPSVATLRDMAWPATPARRLVLFAYLGPLLLPILLPLSIDFNIAAIWTMSAWSLLPIILLSSPLVTLHRPAMLTMIAIVIAFPPIMIAAGSSIAFAIHRGQGQEPLELSSAHSRQLAREVLRAWQRATPHQLRLIGGDSDTAYGVAFYLPSRPLAVRDFRPPWVTPERLKQDGIAVVCIANVGCPNNFDRRRLSDQETEVELTRQHRGVAGNTTRYLIIIVPPQ